MEQGMVPYDSSDEDRDMESEMTHRRSGRQEDLYRQSLHDGVESDEDIELARRAGGNGYGPHRAGNSRSDLFHSGPVRLPIPRRGPTSSGYDKFEEGKSRFDGQPVPGPPSNRAPRDGGSRVPSIDPLGFPPYEERGAEWWAEQDRRARQSAHSGRVVGYYTLLPDDPEGDPIFVPNPILDASYASRIDRHRNSNRGP